jgi:hypothetical protein
MFILKILKDMLKFVKHDTASVGKNLNIILGFLLYMLIKEYQSAKGNDA